MIYYKTVDVCLWYAVVCGYLRVSYSRFQASGGVDIYIYYLA